MSVSRRKFLGQSVLGLTAFSIVPRHVLGKGFLAPSDQLTKAIVGTGGMGRGHIPYAGTRVVAMCDVDKKNLQLGLDKVEKGINAWLEKPDRAWNRDVIASVCKRIINVDAIAGDIVLLRYHEPYHKKLAGKWEVLE